MKILRQLSTHARALGLVFSITSLTAFASFDQDGDGITDANDNCTLINNPQQYDSNNDGIGNKCDADLNNDGIVDSLDQDLMLIFHQDNNLDADINEDGQITNWDLSILTSRLGNPPGPYGINNAKLYAHPRLLVTDKKFMALADKLTIQPYAKFWRTIKPAADIYANEIPPCPIANPNCGAPDNISEYTDNTIRNLGNKLPYMAMAFRLTGDAIYLDGVRNWMNALSSYQNWSNNHDIGAAHILMGMSYAYDWLYDSFTEAERQTYRDKLTLQVNIMYNSLISEDSPWWASDYYSNHNYTNVSAIAITAIALYGESTEADAWIAAAENNYTNVINHLSPDGACKEGVSYWALQMSHILPYFVGMDRYAPHISQQMLDSSYFQNAVSFRLYSSLPNYFQNVDFSDSPRHDYGKSSYVLRGLASIFSDPLAQWLSDRIENARLSNGEVPAAHWLDMLWYSSEIAKTPPDNLPLSRYFDNMGILISRSSWNDDAFWSFHKSGAYQGYHAEALNFYPSSHSQPDEGQFLAWSQGRWLVIEDGLVLLKHTENHNLLTFNNSGQLGSDSKWFKGWQVKFNNGTVIPVYNSVTDDTQYIVTEIAPMYRSSADVSSWQRSFIALQEGYQVIRDDVILNNQGQIDSFVHADYVALPLDDSTVILNPVDSVPEATDLTGNGHDGIITGGFTTPGTLGNALKLEGRGSLHFFGSLDKVSIPTLEGTAFPSSGSLSLWLKSENFADDGFQPLFDYTDLTRDHIFIQTSEGTNTNPISGIEVSFQSADDGANIFENSISLTDNDWHHIVITWDTVNNQGQIFLNNSLIYSADITNENWAPTEQLVTFGNGFKGSIDEVHLFSRVVDESEINKLFSHTLETTVTNLLGHWSLEVINDADRPDYREYSYRIVHPANSVVNTSTYVIPPEERSGPQGNYVGTLLKAMYSDTSTESIIHFVGDVSIPANYDSVSNSLSIAHGSYSIDIDFDDRTVVRTPIAAP